MNNPRISQKPFPEPVTGKSSLYAITIYFVLIRCLKKIGKPGNEIPQKDWSVPLFQAMVSRLKHLPIIDELKENPTARTKYLQNQALEVKKALMTTQGAEATVRIELLYFTLLMRFCGITIDHIELDKLFRPKAAPPRYKLKVQNEKIFAHFNVKDDELQALELTEEITDTRAPTLLLQYNLPIPPSYFVGRKKLLDELHNKVTGSRTRIILIHGVGGMGKTTVMQEYLNRNVYKKYFERIICSTVNKGLDEAFVRTAAVALGIDEQRKQHINSGEQLTFVTGEMSRYVGKNLFVIDNVNEKDYDDLKRLRPFFERSGWSFLITTRTKPDGFEGVDVDELEQDEAEQLFLHHFFEDKPEEDKIKEDTFDCDLSALITYVLRHTLMIEILARVALKSGMSPRALLERLEAEHFRHPELQRTFEVAHGKERLHPEAIHEYILNLFETEHLQRVTGDERTDLENSKKVTMLRFFSVLPTIDIPLADLRYLWNVCPEERIDFENRLDQLRQIGWLQYKRILTGEKDIIFEITYKMHQLIQEVVYEKLQPDPGNCVRLVVKISDILGQMPKDPKPYHRYARSVYDKLKTLMKDRPQLKKND